MASAQHDFLRADGHRHPLIGPIGASLQECAVPPGIDRRWSAIAGGNIDHPGLRHGFLLQGNHRVAIFGGTAHGPGERLVDASLAQPIIQTLTVGHGRAKNPQSI